MKKGSIVQADSLLQRDSLVQADFLLQKEWARQMGKMMSSSDVQSVIRMRIQFLDKLIREKTQAIQDAPPGKLRIDWRSGTPQFYYRSSKEMREGKYITKDRYGLVKVLSQKDYDEKVLKAALRERNTLEKVLEHFPKNSVDEIYGLLSKYRQNMVIPVEKTDSAYIEEWNAREFTGKGFAPNEPELITDRGERVRSKSELIIANILYQEKIPYRYEYPLTLQGVGLVYPDFTVLNVRRRKELIWEHQGRMDDPVYVDHAVMKVQSFILNGYYPGEDLILTAETGKRPLNVQIVKALIRRHCM